MAAADVVTAFEELFLRFNVEDKILKWILAPSGLNVRRLDDFQFAINKHEDADIIVAAAGIKEENAKMLQGSRIRQAHKALVDADKDREALKVKGIQENDLDALLSQPELESLEDFFWRRYKLRLPAWVRPGDVLISRVSREMSKRILSIADVWKTKTLLQQKKAVRKRTRISDSVEVTTGETEDDPVEFSLAKFMELLWTLLLAYVIAGSKARVGAPATEARGADTTLSVVVPFDVVFLYFNRVQEKARQIPPAQALAWVQAKDEAERTAWVERFRESDKPLGVVINECLQMRESCWEYEKPVPVRATPPELAIVPYVQPPPNPKGVVNPNVGAQVDLRRPPKVIKYQLKNGTKLCAEFQANKCKHKAGKCPKGKHLCGGCEKSGRVCGGNHSPLKCNNKKVERK